MPAAGAEIKESRQDAGNIDRLLLVTRNFPPLWGGMELLNLRMAEALAATTELSLVAPVGSAEHAPPSVVVTEVPSRPLLLFLVLAFFRSLGKARRWRPTCVLAGSGLTAPIALIAARFSRARAAVYLHGLDIAVSHVIYRLLWLPAIRRMDIVIANSSATAALARARGVPGNTISIVHPGVDIPGNSPKAERQDEFRELHQLQDKRILLSVGRLTERKGLRQFVQDVLPRIVTACPSAVLVVIGGAPTASLHAKSQSVESIRCTADALQIGRHVKFLGVITDRDALASAYRAADVHVFPVREIPGDPEGFGMVAVEAASFGLATIAYRTGGVVDAVAEGISGYLVAPGDVSALAEKILQLLETPLPREAIYGHARQFAWSRFSERLLRALRKA